MSDIYWNPTTREFQQQQEQASEAVSEAFLEELFQGRPSRDSRSSSDQGTNLPEDLSGLTTEEIRNLPAATIPSVSMMCERRIVFGAIENDFHASFKIVR